MVVDLIEQEGASKPCLESDEGGEERSSLATDHHVADDVTQTPLDLLLDVGGRHVLPACRDDDLLDPPHHLVEALLVHPDEIPGVEPAVVVNGLQGLLLVVEVAHTHGPTTG